MSRKNLIKTNEFYYHVTTRANHKQWFQLPLDQVWEICVRSFKLAQDNAPAEVSQFVLMANHYHLLIKTPDSNIDRFMYFFNKEFSSQLRFKTGLINRMFGGNYKWSVIQTNQHLLNVFRYIYQNPITAQLVERCEDYPYSTLYFTYRNQKMPFSFSPLQDFEKQIDFLNLRQEFQSVERIKKGLKKSIFKEVYDRPT